MGDGEYDADEPAGRRPLPPDDRVWRHPSEVAMDLRQVRARRRSRRARRTATLVGGVVVVSGLVWISRVGPTDTTVATDTVRLGASGPVGDDTDTTAEATIGDSTADADRLFTFTDPDAGSPIVVRAATTGETLAGAFVVRDGYVATSSAALAGADDLLVAWGDVEEVGEVIGRDTITDLAVIRVDGAGADAALTDARVAAGDAVRLPGADGATATQRVVAAASTSALANGDPLVGIVELDGRLGDIPPGSPAYDVDGNVVGVATATADKAPAAIIPIGLAREVAGEIIDDGEADHPWLGIRARNPDGSDDVAGSYVAEVTPDGPAALGGVTEGDVITAIDDASIDSMAAMVATLREFEPGDVVDIVVQRDGETVNCNVELASHLDVA